MTERSKEAQARKILEHLVFKREKEERKDKATQTIRCQITVHSLRYYYAYRSTKTKKPGQEGLGYTKPIKTESMLEALGALAVKYQLRTEKIKPDNPKDKANAVIFIESPTILGIEIEGKEIDLEALFSRWVRDVDNGKGKEELERIGTKAVDLIRNELPKIGLSDFLNTGGLQLMNLR